MEHPINSFQYLLDHWLVLEDRYPYYAFFLFTSEHEQFSDLFQKRFEAWDRLSDHACMFFAVAPPPPGWDQKALQRDYWRYYMAHSEQGRGYDADAVRQAARYFSVPDEYLPAIVLFCNLDHYDVVTIHLAGLNAEECNNLIQNLFLLLNHPRVQRYCELWRLQSLIDHLPIRRQVDAKWCDEYINSQWAAARGKRPSPDIVRNEPLSAHRITYRINMPQTIVATLRSLQQELERLRDEVRAARTEQREDIKQVNVRLERIEVVLQETVERIEDYRRPFVLRWASAEAQADSQRRDEVLTVLHNDFDSFLQQQSNYLVERLQETTQPHVPTELAGIKDELEEESRTVLMTCEVLWQHLQMTKPSYPLDYAVCGIGLWKSLEIELNRSFVDALRVYNGLCKPGQPSTRQSVRPIARMTEDGRRGGELTRVWINPPEELDSNRLRGIELGPIANLMAASDVNHLSKLIGSLRFPLESDDATVHDFMSNLAKKIHEVRAVYRNGYAHLQRMDRTAYEGLRLLILDRRFPHSPLFATVACKVEMLREYLI